MIEISLKVAKVYHNQQKYYNSLASVLSHCMINTYLFVKDIWCTLRDTLHLGIPYSDDIWCALNRYDDAETGFVWCVDTARQKWEEDKTKEGYNIATVQYSDGPANDFVQS